MLSPSISKEIGLPSAVQPILHKSSEKASKKTPPTRNILAQTAHRQSTGRPIKILSATVTPINISIPYAKAT